MYHKCGENKVHFLLLLSTLLFFWVLFMGNKKCGNFSCFQVVVVVKSRRQIGLKMKSSVLAVDVINALEGV